MGKGRIKRILRLCLIEFFDKGDGRYKRIQAVSPWRIFLAKGEEMKRMNSTSFQGLKNQKTLERFWHKEEEDVQRDSRLVKDCNRLIGLLERFIENAKQSFAFIDSSCLVKRTIRRVITFRKP